MSVVVLVIDPLITQEKIVLLAVIFIGNIVGMLSMGYLGDKLGIAKALCLTTAISFVSQLGVAFATRGSNIFTIFTIFRFLLGIGVGGLYPLSAAQAAHEARKSEAQNPSRKSSEAQLRQKTHDIGWNFFWQQPGNVSPYVVGLLMLYLTHEIDQQFRTTVALGMSGMMSHFSYENAIADYNVLYPQKVR